ncbi:phosphatidate phosphatase LPIN1-like isoform X1 [Argiope bruennichi]|uniref:phosphatidate phosphatase LPIN1-like isoform X1 n=2 Tax=Argiope bruennichi TaxID=94029 RepID=UPI0024942CCF|nr:phosphatidate phosphatase LPIN1-like isoform X1 [Argiope bruennichi]XP_055939242.1 phosphatidate phosphatase LPIN1-like isoform X1 [Argiope bruennichi]XP_055939250.1 phosphatidate phosphatase LPIN1-like isoform X1 [Argiope bruennichi]
MLYIGKFINNFKDFYNDINSATLTGAIDVIVVKQPDGSYVCSPFHVRFGKIGVLRSKEKVVDIEVNGVPVDIHMKLGESGEAFFVEGVDTNNEIPSYLATSPLPDVPDIEAEIQKMKLSLKDETSNENKMLSPIIESTKSIHIVSEKDKVLITSSSLSSKQKDCDIVPSDSVVSKKTTTQISETHKSHQKILKVTEESVVSEDIANSVNTDSSDEYKTKRRRRKRAPTKKRSKNKDMSVTKNNGLNHATDVVTKDSEIDKPEEIFQMDDDYVEGDDEGFGSAGGLSRSVSLPVQSKIEDLFDHEWTRRKMSTTFTGEFHPFSDGDVTPQSSPIGSRPPSPKSDTEYENQKIETGSPDLNAPSWSWGQLPNVPRNLSDPHLQGQDQSSHLNEENKDDDASTDAEKRSMLGGVLNFMRSTKKMRHMPEREGIYLSELNSDELDPEVAALYFPKFKNPDHPSQVKDEDTESGKGPSLPHSPHTVEGYGSHLSQDSDSDGGIPLERFSKEDCEKHSYPYSDIAMSLCGGLQDPEVDLPAERFLHSIITFDEFSENPAAVLNDPNLVIRIDGKYYNWQTAASMLTSIIMFQRPLPDRTTTKLVHEHMPKKKKKSYSSWWSWGRTETETKGQIENPQAGIENSTITAVSAITERTETRFEESIEQVHKIDDSEKRETVVVSIEETVKETMTTVTQAVSEACDKDQLLLEEGDELEEVVVESETSADDQIELIQTPPRSESTPMSSSPIDITHPVKTHVDTSSLSPPETVAQSQLSAKSTSEPEGTDKPQKEKYIKSLRLTSKQIENLNLKDGPNEFVFSVTTAYQGTTKCTCQVFLWNYDDKIVISDIDGTITKSDVLGHILPMVGHSWAQLGVANLFTKIYNNGYKFLYLSARAIGQARITRDYLRKVRQGEICLPDGPLLLSPTSLISALHREVIERKPEEFKISCLKDIQTLFPPYMGNPFYAGFGNKINDQWAYRAVGIPLTRSFTINHRGELKLELIQTFQSSYTRLCDDVDHVFPPLKPRLKTNGHPTPIFSSPEEFSYFTYWREPVPPINEDDLSV